MLFINLLPWRDKRAKFYQKRFVYLASIAILLVIFILGLWHMLINCQIQKQLQIKQAITKKIIKLKPQYQKLLFLQKQEKTMLAFFQRINVLKQKRAQSLHMLVEVQQILPKNAVLEQLNKNNSEVEFSGFAANKVVIAKLITNIEQSFWFQNPKVKAINDHGFHIWLTCK